MLQSVGAWILLPMVAQMLLTVGVLVRLGIAKKSAFLAGLVDRDRFGLHEDAWPDSVIQISNNLRNQFELPVLFYALCITLFVLNAGGWLAIALATIFVATRCFHAAIHLGGNVVPKRRQMFIYGLLSIAGLLILCLIAIFRHGAAFHGL